MEKTPREEPSEETNSYKENEEKDPPQIELAH